MRRRYLIAYDITDDRRRTRAFNTLGDFGESVQYSVFFVDLTSSELVLLRGKLRELIDERTDQVLVVDLGRVRRELDHSIEVLGVPYEPSTRTLIV
jgi:CRISPR-associated protein Cas2